MTRLEAPYDSIRHSLKPGYGVGFETDGFVSNFIQYWTRPCWWKIWEWSRLSHWATVLTLDERIISTLIAQGHLKPPRNNNHYPRVVLAESTILNDKHGVQVNWASERIADYNGSVYVFPLSAESQRKLNRARYTQFLVGCIGLPYDKVLIGHMLFDRFNLIPSREDWDSMICSEVGAAALKLGELLPANLNSSDVTPQRMAEFKIWAENYWQVKGKPRDIKKYNTRKVNGRN